MSEINDHCQCDHCSGRDCGQDDTDRYLKQKQDDEDKHDQQIRAQVLEEVLNIMKEQMEVFGSDYNDPNNPNSKPYLDGKINGARIVIMEVEARNHDVEIKNNDETNDKNTS